MATKIEEKKVSFKDILKTTWDATVKSYRWLNKHPVRMTVIISLVMCLIVEILARKSLWEAGVFAGTNMVVFLYDSLIIFSTMCISLLIPKRKFVLLLGIILWLGLGITNCVILGFRITPFEATDFSMLKSALTMTSIYMQWWQVVLVIGGFIAAAVLLTFAFIKLKKEKINWRKSIFTVCLTAILLTVSTILFRATGILGVEFSSPAAANKEYGFAYCFSCSVFDKGISKPKTYSEDVMNEIADRLENSSFDNTADITPNIIFVQLESFWDVKNMNSLTCSENPNPIFDELMEKYPSGYLTVPSIGAGTANTEFEVISGMNLSYFGTGEYPYKTILKKSSCESVCYNLKDYGYATHALHNNSGTFYDRNLVFASLGFDTYTSVEYMDNVERNDIGWALDTVLTDEVLKVLKSTENRDLVYAISVQAHGKYPADYVSKEGDITISGLEDEERTAQFNYYVNEVKSVDNFVGEFVSAMANVDEPTMVVFYGDHLPTLGITEEEVPDSNLFQVEYVIWNNFNLKAEDKDLEAYQLNAHVTGLLGMDGGLLAKLHQNESDSVDYEQQLELLQYDMLYGDKVVYGGLNFHEKTALMMGTYPITVTYIHQDEGGIYITGTNFTPFSYVMLDGDKQETTFVDKNTLFVEGETLNSGMEVYIAQIGKDKEVLSTTNSYIIS